MNGEERNYLAIIVGITLVLLSLVANNYFSGLRLAEAVQHAVKDGGDPMRVGCALDMSEQRKVVCAAILSKDAK